MTQNKYNFGYAELSRAKQEKTSGGRVLCEKTQAEKDFLAILEKNLFLEQEDWGTGIEGKSFSLDDLEVEFADYTGVKEDSTHLSSLDALSKVVSSLPNAFKSNRLSAVNRQVCKIDRLPDRYKTTQVLLLSNNYIEDLRGLEQFSALKTLSLSNNLIKSFSGLEHASKACKALENANFEGNQICRHPFYRSHVVNLFPSLIVLDNSPVIDKERKVAKRDVSFTTERTAEIVQNYCLACFLTHIADLLCVHNGIRSRASQAETRTNPSVPVTRASIRTLISSWKKESHFSSEALRDIGIHFCLEVSKVRHQLQYFCKMSGMKQDKYTLWVTAFDKILARQEGKLRVLSSQIEQFTPLDVANSPIDVSKEIALATQMASSGRKGRGGVLPTLPGESVPLARRHGPCLPISERGGEKKDESRHRDRSSLRFRPIEKRAAGSKPIAKLDLDSEDPSFSANQLESLVSATYPSMSPHPTRDSESEFASSLSEQNVREEVRESGGENALKVGTSIHARKERCNKSELNRGEGKALGSGGSASMDSLLFQISPTAGVFDDVGEESHGDAYLVEELKMTVDTLDREASASVHSVNKAIGDLNNDIDGIIAAQQSLQQQIIHKKLVENETKSLLSLQIKENAKLQESTKAIDVILEENSDLKYQVVSLQQELQEALGKLRRESEKVDSYKKELRTHTEFKMEIKMMEERDLLCKRLAARSLGRRVFFHYALNVRLAQKQREAVAQIKRRVASRVKREVLIWWRAVRERELLGNMFAMTRQERLKMNTVTHWKNWAAKHKSKRLAMLDICDRADAIYKLKTLRSWQARTCAMVKTQRDMAYTFQQYWVRRKVFLGFSNLIQKKRWKMQMSALVDRHRLQMWFSFWCTWCSGEAEARDSAAKADGFRRHWLKRTTFNKLLLLVVVNERRHIAKLVALNHYVKQIQCHAVESWKGHVRVCRREKLAVEHTVRWKIYKAFMGWKAFWDDQITRRVRRKRMGVIGKIIANEKSAQLRSMYFFKWFAYTKNASARLLEDQILEQQTQAEHVRERMSSFVSNRLPVKRSGSLQRRHQSTSVPLRVEISEDERFPDLERRRASIAGKRASMTPLLSDNVEGQSGSLAPELMDLHAEIGALQQRILRDLSG